MNTFYAAMDRLEKRLETNRFLFGDYVTDSDIRLYVTLARLDIRYTAQLGETKRPLYTYKNLWGRKRAVGDSGICTSHRFCSHHPPGKN